MGERSYLSIGDVLALLREEFPDITISKIRFLESRGLLVPERTPSGYRKFYDHDVERLRWILRQQREHFLPLKVIKGRLEGAEAAQQPESLFDPAEPPPAGMVSPELSNVSAIGSSNGSHPSGGHPAEAGRSPARVATMARGEESANLSEGEALAAVREIAPVRVPGEHPSERHAASGEASRPSQSAQPAPSLQASGRAAGSGPATPPARRSEAASAPQVASDLPTGRSEVAEGPAPAETAKSGSRTSRPAGEKSHGGSARAALIGASMTAGELAQSSGLSVAQVEELESFGLIEGRTVAGVHCFDEDALGVAKLAASFASYGVEARHLRIFKHAAERQEGLYSQVVMPLLRQRNPDARAKAHDDLQKMAELGTMLQACFMQASLRDLTGG